MGTATETAASGSSGASDSFVAEMFSARLYKPSQGRVTRQATGGAIWLAFALGAWRWYATSAGFEWLATIMDANTVGALRYALPSLLLLVGVWIGYRVVNYSRFADFLIAVEAEMNKVMWPSQDELVRSSIVVIVLLISFAALMYAFDVLWLSLFKWIGIRV